MNSASGNIPASESRTDLSEQFRVIAELRGEVAWVVDCATGLPTYVSPSVAVLLGYDMADFSAQLSGSGNEPDLAALCAGLPARLQRFAAGDASRRHLVRQFEQRHRDGRMIPVELISTLLLDADGKPGTLVGVMRDNSEQQQRIAQQRRFASMLNHEFRTPLSTIDGAIQRLEVTGANADEPTRQRYRKIQSAVDRLIGMLDEYLSPDRMEDIGGTRPADSLSPRLLLEEAGALVGASGRAVSVDSGDLPPAVRCQPPALRLALKVLVENAMQYSSDKIELSGRWGEDGIELLVRDHGDGVPEKETGSIFTKRYRGSNAQGSGSGLGLYMARSVIDVHGGTISVQNVQPKGALFTIWLPAQRRAGKTVASEVINGDNSANQQTRVGAVPR